MMGKHLVLVGGGHAHMVTLANLHTFMEKGHKVTVIGPSHYHYYSGMGPGMLGKTYTPDDIRFATKDVVEKKGGAFVLGKAKTVDPGKKLISLESGETIPYDVVSFNAGSYVSQDCVSEDHGDIFPVKPIERLLDAQRRIIELSEKKDIHISVVGGGPAALEVAGNVWRLGKDHCRQMPLIRLFAGREFMSRYSKKIQRLAKKSLIKRHIAIIESGYVKGVKTGQITLENGEDFSCDFIFLAHGVHPSEIFKASGLSTGPDGGLPVNRYLQSIEYPEIFGGGDCIYFQDRPLNKVGVYAVRENPVIFANLMASLEGGSLTPFNPGGHYLLVYNMGDDTGILMKKWLVMGGRPAFMIKDYIDRKFMTKFQAIER
jgi:NADH dehydrogenase FAD-containing subunit